MWKDRCEQANGKWVAGKNAPNDAEKKINADQCELCMDIAKTFKKDSALIAEDTFAGAGIPKGGMAVILEGECEVYQDQACCDRS